MGDQMNQRRAPALMQLLLLALVFAASWSALAAQDSGAARHLIPPWRRPFVGIRDVFDFVEAERFVSSDGRRYVVVDERGGERRAELLRRRPHAEALAPIQRNSSVRPMGVAEQPLRFDEDESLLDVPLGHGICEILVPERLVGFALFIGSSKGDNWRLCWIDGKGEAAFFIDVDKCMRRGAWGNPCLEAHVRGAWIDEDRGEIVMLSPPDVHGQTVVCVASVASGKLREGCSADERLRWAMFGAEASRLFALELIGSSTVDECRRAMAMLGGVAFDPELSPLLRLHAAWILARGGRPEQAAPMFRAAIEPALAEPTQKAAAERLCGGEAVQRIRR